MKRNISSADRIIRVIIAAAIAVLYFTHIITGIVGIVLLIAGAIFLLTSFINFCPLYFLLGITTYKQNQRKHGTA